MVLCVLLVMVGRRGTTTTVVTAGVGGVVAQAPADDVWRAVEHATARRYRQLHRDHLINLGG